MGNSVLEGTASTEALRADGTWHDMERKESVSLGVREGQDSLIGEKTHSS